jgi:hypothetical protein
MTAHRDLKQIIRERQEKTGESYTAARAHVMRVRAEQMGLEATAAPPSGAAESLEAVVLKVVNRSARVRILGEEGQVTFRSMDAWSMVPGQVATLVVKKRWTFKGHAYASGRFEDARIDVAKLGLEPLPISGGESDDLRSSYEPYRRPDPYAPLWRKLTAKPRAAFEMNPITWGAFPGEDPENEPTLRAVELSAAGDVDGARDLLMDTLLRDLRCLDAHAHLGNLEFDHSPNRALVHYEIGLRIGELSLPAGFDGVLPWGRLYNRPFLRCLNGYGLALWRLGRLVEAQQAFERNLSLNPNDNQGVRFCWEDVRRGRTWEECQEGDETVRQ